MALWIRNRPPERCHSGEVAVADFLTELSDDWVICWGFRYEGNTGANREGDFLVLGPDGGLLVLEVKSGQWSLNPYTGEWTTASGDNPQFQLDEEWDAVCRRINDHRGNRPSLFVGRALGAPDLNLDPKLTEYHGIDRGFIFDRGDLRCFQEAWSARMQLWKARLDPRSRDVFFETYGESATPRAIQHFVDDTDRVLMRLTEASFPLLSQLEANSQFFVSGGVGSGKTWLAIELARQWSQSQRQRVLVVGYNLALVAFLKTLIERLVKHGKIPAGQVDVRSWEDLASEALASVGLSIRTEWGDADRSARTRYYEIELPAELKMLVEDGSVKPRYDALVVDEAQDQDTCELSDKGQPVAGGGPGWWTFYWALLHGGASARQAIFYDTAQRPRFRAGEFRPERLLKVGGFRPVRIQLQGTLRYSRSIFEHLKSLDSPAIAPLVAGLHQRTPLPPGVDVEEVEVEPGGEADAVTHCIRKWLEQGWCRPEQVAILSMRGALERSALAGQTHIAGKPLENGLVDVPRGSVGFGSVNRAKGLDCLAVVLVDFEPWTRMNADAQMGYFLGASRARQLLAVITTRAA